MPALIFFSSVKSRRRGIVGGFFAVLIGLGIWLYQDYGVSWDEPNNHLNGLVSAKYLAQLVAPERVAQQPGSEPIPDIRAFADADHGVAFELPLAVLSYLFLRLMIRRLSTVCAIYVCFSCLSAGAWALYRSPLRAMATGAGVC